MLDGLLATIFHATGNTKMLLVPDRPCWGNKNLPHYVAIGIRGKLRRVQVAKEWMVCVTAIRPRAACNNAKPVGIQGF